MKRQIVLVALIATMFAASAMLFGSAVAQQPLVTSTATPTRLPTYSVVLASDIFVRGGPGSSFLPVGRLASGDVLTPLSRNAAGDWVLIAYNRGFGWIRRDLAYWSINIDDLPLYDETDLTPTLIPGTVEATPFAPTATLEGNWVRAGDRGAFLRAGPSIQFPILDSLADGETVEPVGRDEESDWILIRRGDQDFAWISRPLVSWTDDLTSLPVLLNDALTPSATFTNTATLTRTPRPSRTYTPTSTFTPTDTLTPTLTDTATNTSTPSLTPSDTATLTRTATRTFTVTPSATFTETDTATATLSLTPEPSDTSTSIPASPTDEPPTARPTDTQPPTASSVAQLAGPVQSETPSASPTLTHSASNTATATRTASQTASNTREPPTQTVTPSRTASSTPVPATRTAVPASPTVEATEVSANLQSSSTAGATRTTRATATNTLAPTSTATETFDAGATATRMILETAVANRQSTVDAAATLVQQTAAASPAATDVPATATVTPTTASSQTPIPATTAPTVAPTVQPVATETTDIEGSSQQAVGGIRPELLVAGLLLLLALIYVALYLRGASRTNLYTSGFVVERCPVCARGTLYTETRQERILGIPRIQFTVRCTECRSVLREVGSGEWRYAVDPAENPELFERWNNRVVTNDQLKGMAAGRRAGLGSRSHVRPRTAPPDESDAG